MSEHPSFRPCAIVPTYDNPETIERVVKRVRAYIDDVFVVDDGSHPKGRDACSSLSRDGVAVVVTRPENGGKGAAVKTGLRCAAARGFTHAFQVDADGQHDIACMPDFLQAAAHAPDALVLGYPVYDASLPKVRGFARRFTSFWVSLEVGPRTKVADAMTGFRVYPLASVEAFEVSSNRMDYDVEVVVRAVWHGLSIVNLPVGVRYLAPEEGGRSHFRPFRDNLGFAWLHSKLCTAGATRFFLRRTRGLLLGSGMIR